MSIISDIVNKLKKKRVIRMIINKSKPYQNGTNGTTTTVCIDLKAISDDETITFLERTISYTVNTIAEGWERQTEDQLNPQYAEFEIDAARLVEIQNKIANIAVGIGG